ncbi:alpha/beta hydrolase [Roseomonas elaeocarpi]|uniref:Alpha/beta hydrolase n=1 Tax=Roseomonas elaeocarpi TaxID=907779 RepID=A0ABV6JQL4_9PROT
MPPAKAMAGVIQPADDAEVAAPPSAPAATRPAAAGQPARAFELPVFDAEDLSDLRAMNARLDRFPRFRVRGQWEADLIQALLRGSQLLSSLRYPRGRIVAENRMVRWRDRSARVRIIRPSGACQGLYLDIHGGAWAVGNAEMDDPVNAAIARDCGLATVSIDYRLAGRHPLEEVFRDCETAAGWALDEGLAELAPTPAQGETVRGATEPTVFIGGESAGAHLAVTTLLRLRDAGQDLTPVRGAVLFYGAFDLGGSAGLLAAPPGTLVLHHRAAEALHQLLPGLSVEERRAARYSPLFAPLHGLPPALFLVGEADPLREESVEMCRRWRDAGNPAALLRVPEAPHAFNRFPSRVAYKANAAVRAWINAGAAVPGRDQPGGDQAGA